MYGKRCCIYKKSQDESGRIYPVMIYQDEVHTDKSDWYRTGVICSLILLALFLVLVGTVSVYFLIPIAVLCVLAGVFIYFENQERNKRWNELVAISQNDENMKLRDEYLEQRVKIEAEIERLEDTPYAELTPYLIDKLEKLKKDIRYEVYL